MQYRKQTVEANAFAQKLVVGVANDWGKSSVGSRYGFVATTERDGLPHTCPLVAAVGLGGDIAHCSDALSAHARSARNDGAVGKLRALEEKKSVS